MSQRSKLTTTLTGLIAVAIMAGVYLMGRSDERAGRPFSLANPAQAAEAPTISPVKARATYFPTPKS